METYITMRNRMYHAVMAFLNEGRENPQLALLGPDKAKAYLAAQAKPTKSYQIAQKLRGRLHARRERVRAGEQQPGKYAGR